MVESKRVYGIFEASLRDDSEQRNSQGVFARVQSAWWKTAGLTAVYLSSRPGRKIEQNDEKVHVWGIYLA